MGYDIDALRRDNPLSELLPRRFGVALEKNGREWEACCPFHSEDTPSFTVYRSRKGHERFQCFGCDAAGDILDFVQLWDTCTFPEACETLGGKRELAHKDRKPAAPIAGYDPYAGYTIKRPPANAPELRPGKRTPELLNPKRRDDAGNPKSVTYKPTLVHAVRDREGRLVGYVLRVDIEDDRKNTPSILWAENAATGFKGWTHAPFPEPRPLYGIHDDDGTKQIVIVEGEKCRDRAAAVLDVVTVLSWIGGGKAYGKTNWKRLAGRSVLLWPDADPEGHRTMFGYWKDADRWQPGIGELLLDAGAARIKAIDIAGDNKPDGWDVADAIDEGADRAALIAFMKPRTFDLTREWLDALRDRTRPAQPAKEKRQEPAKPAAITVAQAKPEPAKEPAKPATRREPKPLGENVVSIGTPGSPTQMPPPDPNRDIPIAAQYLYTTKEKKDQKSLHNAMVDIRLHPDLAGLFRYNELGGRVYLMRKPPWTEGARPAPFPREMTDDDVIRCRGYMERLEIRLGKQDIGAAIVSVAKENTFNRVREYLDALTWDGTSRLRGERDVCQTWLTEYLGAKDTAFTRALALRFPLSVVARIYEPGAKVDTVLILEGKQGARKSTALEILGTIGGVSYYSDSITDLNSKDTLLMIRGKLIAELPELSALKKGDPDAIKGWISRKEDEYRAPYLADTQRVPRTAVFCGTVNPSGTGYLKDITGGRRFNPLRVSDEIDTDALAANVEQIYAEAVTLYKAGERWWFEGAEKELAEAEQDKRLEQDPLSLPIEQAIGDKEDFITVAKVMENMGIPVAQRTTALSDRVANHLRKEGWTYLQRREGAGRVRGWQRPKK